MAWQMVQRRCGHETKETLYGPGKERDRRVAWLRTQPCLDCQRAAERDAAATQADAAGLPALAGSEKQVSWALTIRATALRAVDALLAPAKATYPDGDWSAEDALVAKLAAQTSAAWWIDHRHEAEMPKRLLLAAKEG